MEILSDDEDGITIYDSDEDLENESEADADADIDLETNFDDTETNISLETNLEHQNNLVCGSQNSSSFQDYNQSISSITEEGEIPPKRVPISLKTKADINFEHEQSELCTHDNIMKVILSNCCKDKCFSNISRKELVGDFSEAFNLVKSCRSELLGLVGDERNDVLRSIISSKFC